MRFSLVLFLLAAPCALAQPAVDFGLRVGADLSQLEAQVEGVTLNDFTERELGVQVAVLADASLSEFFAATAEIGYARRRYSQIVALQFGDSPSPNDVAAELVTSFSTGFFGLIGRFSPYRYRSVSPYAVAGPRLDVLLGSNPGKTEAGTPTLTVVLEDVYPQSFADVSLSGVVGLGVALRSVGQPIVRLEARYSRTVTDFLKLDAFDGRISGFDLSVGVTF